MAGSPVHPHHGGDVAFATARYGQPPGGWLDLSTGINPVPFPVPPLVPDDLGRLPARDSLDALILTARKTWRIPSGVAVAATPGTEIAIRLLPLVAPPGDVAILGPTYGSHPEAWRNAGREVLNAASLEEIAPKASVVVLANPNNPDGRQSDPERLAHLAVRLGNRGGLLVVDEAFADVAPEISLAPRLAGLSAVGLRSFGKFFGLPGLRLGFAAGAQPVIERLISLLGDWPVSGPAIAIGRAALRDGAWQEETRRRLKRDMARLRRLLSNHSLAVTGGTDLFALVTNDNAGALHGALASRGIWTRVFDTQPHWLRLGVPGDEAAFARLDQALAAATAGR